jgi:hypothetical protein
VCSRSFGAGWVCGTFCGSECAAGGLVRDGCVGQFVGVSVRDGCVSELFGGQEKLNDCFFKILSFVS